MTVTRRILALAAVGLLGIGGQASAQDVQFIGYTQGCFNDPGHTNCNILGSNDQLLLYTNAIFSQAINGSGSLDLGRMYRGLGNFSGDQFLLDVFFLTPNTSGSPALFTAVLSGSVTFFGGNIGVDFGGPQSFAFQNAHGQTGQFSLWIDDIALTARNTTADVIGHVRVDPVTATPEPATTALLATGLLALVPVYRSRRRKEQL